MKINTEIVTGFLDAGKTSFINSLIKESQSFKEKILIFQFEFGKTEIKVNKNKNYPLKVISVDSLDELNLKFGSVTSKYKPNRIIIEYNGTCNLNDLVRILNNKENKDKNKISTVYYVADSRNFKEYINNIGDILVPFIQSSNMVVLNNMDSNDNKTNEYEIKRIKSINPKAFILKVPNKYSMNLSLKESDVIDNGIIKKLKIKIMNYKEKEGTL